MLVSTKEYAEKNGFKYNTVRAAAARGKLPSILTADGRRLVDINEPWKSRMHTNDEFHKGMSYSAIYNVWRCMKQRCNNPNASGYKNYGGRGISVCNEWEKSSEAFYDWALANGYAPGLQIDRIDNDGNYEPSNCRWVTPKENASNRRPRPKKPIPPKPKKPLKKAKPAKPLLEPLSEESATYYDLKRKEYVWTFDYMPIEILKDGYVIDEIYIDE